MAPFDAAACFLVLGMAIILSSWTENYGDPSENKDLLTQFRGAAVAIASGRVLTLFLSYVCIFACTVSLVTLLLYVHICMYILDFMTLLYMHYLFSDRGE